MQFIGDIDNDGKITQIDALLIFSHKSGEITLSAEELLRADADGNGKVELADALRILKHITGEILIDEVIK